MYGWRRRRDEPSKVLSLPWPKNLTSETHTWGSLFVLDVKDRVGLGPEICLGDWEARRVYICCQLAVLCVLKGLMVEVPVVHIGVRTDLGRGSWVANAAPVSVQAAGPQNYGR